MNPNVGIMIYEVKDWSLDTYKWKNESGRDEVLKHVLQLDHYRKKIIEQLIPDIGEKIDNNNEAFSTVTTGIYLHKIKSDDVRKLFNSCNNIKTCRHMAKVGFDGLKVKNLGIIVPYFNLPKSKFMKKEWADEIDWWLMPPQQSIEQTTDIKLTQEQKRHAEPNPGPHRIRGVAGSGKTLVLAYRAAKLAENGNRVLILTYNITLWHYIRDMIARAPFKVDYSNIVFNHFHGFCNDVLNELNESKPKKDDYFKLILSTVDKAIENYDIENLKYDAILIDEGQDFKREWFDLLNKFLKDRKELVYFVDFSQNIYKRDLAWIKGRWGELKTIHRLPKVIADVAINFSEEFKLHQSVEITEHDGQLTIYEKPPILHWENIIIDDWLSNVEEAYELIKNRQLNIGEGHASDIVILLPTHKMGKKAVELFNQRNIEINHVFKLNEYPDNPKNFKKSTHHKKSFWRGDSRLKMSTIHSFKGWEALHVILVIPDKWLDDEDLDSLVYTALTRTRKNLIVLNCNEKYWDFGDSLIESDEQDQLQDYDETEIENWIETLPYPLASILWAKITSLTFEHKVKYLLHFFEAFSKFNFNLMLSGLSTDKFAYETDVASCFSNEDTKYGEWWFNEPSFGNWNYYGSSLSAIIRNQLNDKYQRNQCFKQFGKPKNDLLFKISDYDLYRTLKKAAKYRNVWEAHGPRVSEDEYKKRHEKLMSLLYNVQNIISNAFEDNLLIIPVQSSLEDGNYDNTVKKFMGTNERFRPMQIETSYPLDKSRIYMVTKNKRKPLELLPLIRVKDEVCYFYNGKNQHDGLSRYVSYYNEDKAEISLPEDENLVGLLKFNG